MNPYIEKLKAYLSNRPTSCRWEDGNSILELLCYIYTVQNPIHNSVILYQFRELNRIEENLTWEERERLSELVCQLCTEHMRKAFLEGLQVGFRLFTELSEPEKYAG